MAKTGSGKNYTSKGERRNVARRAVLALRADRRANPTIKDMMKRHAHRQQILNSPKGAHEKKLAERYAEEDRVEFEAGKLLEQYGSVGLTKAAAVQAIKTNYTDRLHEKWSPILKKASETGRK